MLNEFQEMIKKTTDIILVFQRIFVLLMIHLMAIGTFAYDFEINGIYYDIISSDQVEVTYMLSQMPGYSGIISIPNKVVYRNTAIPSYQLEQVPLRVLR